MTPDDRLALALAADHPDDAARVLERGDPRDAAAFLGAIPAPRAAAVYRLLGPVATAACSAALSDEALVAILTELPLDAAAVGLRSLAVDRRHSVVASLPGSRGTTLGRLLAYAPDTVGAVADPNVLALPDDLTVGDAQKQVRASDLHLGYFLYVVTRDQTLTGVLDVTTLMAARAKDTVAAHMRPDPVRLEASVPLATLAAHPAWRDFDALPVVESTGKLVGVVRHKTVRQIEASRHRAGGDAMVATVVGLSELYWAGLTGMLTSLLPATRSSPSREEVRDAP